jgi:xylan 1,4-beta-xylosidase
VDDWALYAGVEFGGNADYPKAPDSFAVIASSANSGGIVEVWLDSIDTGNKIAECNISSTGDWEIFDVFTSDMDSVSGRHDVYLKFTGDGTEELFRIQWLKFLIEGDSLASIEEPSTSQIPKNFVLEQNYPNPFTLSTTIRFGVPKNSFLSLKVYNPLGQEVAVIAEREFSSGVHSVTFDASHLAAGMYFYRLTAGSFTDTKKLLLVK